MATAEIHLSEAESKALRTLAESTGKTESELLHEAVECFLSQPDNGNRLALLRQARGIWKDRADLSELKELRAELDRLG